MSDEQTNVLFQFPIYFSFIAFEKKEKKLFVKEENKFREELVQMKKPKLIHSRRNLDNSETSRFQSIMTLLKITKLTTPPKRPIVATFRLTYNAFAAEFAIYLRDLLEAYIKANVMKVQETLEDLNKDDAENLISLDVVCLLTNVPVANAISLAT